MSDLKNSSVSRLKKIIHAEEIAHSPGRVAMAMFMISQLSMTAAAQSDLDFLKNAHWPVDALPNIAKCKVSHDCPMLVMGATKSLASHLEENPMSSPEQVAKVAEILNTLTGNPSFPELGNFHKEIMRDMAPVEKWMKEGINKGVVSYEQAQGIIADKVSPRNLKALRPLNPEMYDDIMLNHANECKFSDEIIPYAYFTFGGKTVNKINLKAPDQEVNARAMEVITANKGRSIYLGKEITWLDADRLGKYTQAVKENTPIATDSIEQDEVASLSAITGEPEIAHAAITPDTKTEEIASIESHDFASIPSDAEDIGEATIAAAAGGAFAEIQQSLKSTEIAAQQKPLDEILAEISSESQNKLPAVKEVLSIVQASFAFDSEIAREEQRINPSPRHTEHGI